MDLEVQRSAALMAEIVKVGISGAGSVKYKGSPGINQSISGAGSVKKVD